MPSNGRLYGVTPEQLHQAANVCRSTNQQIQGQIQRGTNIIATLMGEASGADFVQLQTVYDHWNADAIQLNQVLTTIASGLDSSANNYGSAVAQNTANVSSVGGSLPGAKL
jgi:WXG100 family type VII secretion target